MLLDLVALDSRFKILLGDTHFVSFLPEQLVISRFPSNFREIFLTGFLLTGGNFVESLWGSDICPTRMGIFLHVNLYSCIWSVENILCGGHHVTVAVDVLRDRWVRWTSVRFSGGPSTGEYYERMKQRYQWPLLKTMGKEKICVDQYTLSERIIMMIFTQGRRDNTYSTFILFFIRGYGDNLKEITKKYF